MVRKMAELLEIINNKHTPPATLVLDSNNNLVYQNEKSQAVLYLLSKNWALTDRLGNEPSGVIPVKIFNFCDKLREISAGKYSDKANPIPSLTSIISFGSELYSLRALLLHNSRKSDDASIIVLIENIPSVRKFDLEEIYHEI